MSAYSNKFKSTKKGPAHGGSNSGEDDQHTKTGEHKYGKDDPRYSRSLTQLTGQNPGKLYNGPSNNQVCLPISSYPSPGTGGGGGDRVQPSALVPRTEGADGRCPVQGQEDIDSFGTNAPTRKKYDPAGLPQWSEEGLWGQYRP
tara:strand:- start:221 stop:652 length:432 start_codon:yes stop_codon:yes gene_type:complete